MHLLQRISFFWSFYRRAHTIYDVHSPLLSDILLPLFYEKKPKTVLIEKRRKWLSKDKRQIYKTEYGAGSTLLKGKKLFVNKMAATSPVSSKEGSWLAILADKQNIKTVLELGTHFGLSGAYLITLNKNAQLFTIEGCPETAAIAEETFAALNLQNRVCQQIGSFDEILPSFLPHCPPIDLVFIDGNHRGQPLLHYLDICSPFLSANGMIILSDIYWSGDMKKTWDLISQNYTHFHAIDLFYFGILISRKNEKGERHTLSIVDLIWKPWRIGLFQ
jgi:predicted O-methyltransferase YrrM